MKTPFLLHNTSIISITQTILKKVYLLLFLTTFPIVIFCQQENKIVLDSTYGYKWNSELNDWEIYPNTRIINLYDANGYQIEKLSYYRDKITNELVGSRRELFSYDANGYQIGKISCYWDSKANDWLNSQYEVYINDINGKPIEHIRYGWDTLSNEWIESQLICPWGNCWQDGGGGRILYSYNINGNPNPLTEVDFGFNSWSYGNADTITYFDWDTTINDWIYYLKRIFSFSDYGFVTEGIEYRWDTVSSEWILDGFRLVYEYDDSNNLTKAIVGGCWLSLDSCYESSYYTFIYDANGKLIETREYWGGDNDEWENGGRSEFIYDSEGNLEKKLYYSYLDLNALVSKVIYYWSETITSSTHSSIGPIYNIYPNPTNDLLTIETDKSDLYSIKITTLNSQLIYSLIGEGKTHVIDLSSLQKGIYFINIRSKDFAKIEKIIKL